jgi:hypothetical protein
MYATVVPAEMFFPAVKAGNAVAVPALPKLYVPEVRLSVPADVSVNPASLKMLFVVSLPIVSVGIVAAAARETPVLLLTLTILYVYPAIVWAAVPLQ